MAAKIIRFPGAAKRPANVQEIRRAAAQDVQTLVERTGTDQHAHVVAHTDATVGHACESQRQALRIVHEVRQEISTRDQRPEKSAPVCLRKVPLPPPQLDTPFIVARRLVHYLLSLAEPV